MKTLVLTSLNAVNWIYRMAYLDNLRIQPMLVQRILYLSQAHYAALTNGRMFIPAVFVATHEGPVEPNLFQILMYGILESGITPQPPSQEGIDYLEVVWRKYGHHSAKHLLKLIVRDGVFSEVKDNTIITLDRMMWGYKHGPESGKVRLIQRYTQTGKVMVEKDWSALSQADIKNVVNHKEKTSQPNMTMAEMLALKIAKENMGQEPREAPDIVNHAHPRKGAPKNIKTAPQVSDQTKNNSATVLGQTVNELISDYMRNNQQNPHTQHDSDGSQTLSNLKSQTSQHTQKVVTGRWTPKKASKNAEIVRSNIKKNSAPDGGFNYGSDEF